MARALTAGMITEVSARETTLVLLVKAEFDGGTQRFWTGYGDRTFMSETYTGAGDLLSISGIRETSAIIATGVTLQLAGEISALISLALAEDYQQRPITMWLGSLDSSDALIADPFQIFKGKMDTMSIQTDGAQTVISLTSESDMIRLDRPNGRRFNSEDQKRDYPNDLFFDFLPFLADKTLFWGREAERAPITDTPPAPGTVVREPTDDGFDYFIAGDDGSLIPAQQVVSQLDGDNVDVTFEPVPDFGPSGEIRVNRHDHWPRLLSEAIQAAAQTPWSWATDNCALFTADCVLAMTGTDIAKGYRGRYKTARGWNRIIKGDVEIIAVKICEAHAMKEIDPAYAQRGDIVIFLSQGEKCVGVVSDNAAMVAAKIEVPEPPYVALIPRRDAGVSRAWRP